ncbi:MAG: bifunctional 5,10-methylenetetrahydrofolate dehydrogenase/5,10-methenyltetrahydrofolate cyclohydrolase [Acidimicrobiia bacterium]
MGASQTRDTMDGHPAGGRLWSSSGLLPLRLPCRVRSPWEERTRPGNSGHRGLHGGRSRQAHPEAGGLRNHLGPVILGTGQPVDLSAYTLQRGYARGHGRWWGTAVGTRAAVPIDGTSLARELKQEVAQGVADLLSKGIRPGLATVSFEGDFAAAAYERGLRRLASDLRFYYRCDTLPQDVEEADAVAAVGKLNAAPDVSGIVILRPLPSQISEGAMCQELDPLKDVEAVHPTNAGLLALGRPRYVPSTAASCFYLLDRYMLASGRDPLEFYARSNMVVVGRSANVGRPASLLGLARNATVVCCDEHTFRAGNLYEYTRNADILVVAAGVAGLIRGDHVKEGVIAVDVGINPVASSTGVVSIVGDIDQGTVAERAEAITPVPGGVGPVTSVWLLKSTVQAARLVAGLDDVKPPTETVPLEVG